MKQYQPLYLKYRPQKLSELIGQQVVTKTLTNAISYNKIVHAYLFYGPRGTGKTSTARILAKSLNCEKGITAEPCDKCTNCLSIINGNSLDVIEIDAASHRKVEDAEDLINRVNLGTYGSRFKVYIIDEIHMLTDHAFNALLKTLEEPPKNVIFILATTEEYKVIPTIISRCQKLEFKPVSESELELKIKDIAKEEKINIDQTIVSFISKRSNGCLRDAISLLDQISVLQIEDKQINPNEVFKLFGTVDRLTLFKLLNAILSFERKEAIDVAEDLIKSGKDIGELFKDLLELIIDLAKAKIDKEYRKLLAAELSNDLNRLDTMEKNHLLKIIEKLQDAQTKLRFALSQELQFMVNIMSMLDEDFLVSVTELKERVEKLEGKQVSETKAVNTDSEISDRDCFVANAPRNDSFEAPEHPPQEKGIFPAGDLNTLWHKIVSSIDSNPTKTLLSQSDSYLISLTTEVIEIGISKDMFLPRLEKDIKKKEMIIKATKQSSGIEPKIIKFKIALKKKDAEIPYAKVENNKIEFPELEHKNKTTVHVTSTSNDDELTKAVKDLLGAKELE